jgi:hypothetical protein
VRLADRLPRLPVDPSEEGVFAAAWILVALGLVGYAAFAIPLGLSPLTILRGGVYVNPEEGTAYFYLAPFLIVPAALLLLWVGIRTRSALPSILGISLAAVMVNSLAPAGNRLWLMTLLASLAIYPVLRSGWRPPRVLVLALVVPLLYVVVALRDLDATTTPLGMVNAVATAVANTDKSVRELTTGADTEMFDALNAEIQYVPSEVPYEPLLSVRSLVTHPVPRSIWPEKPYPADNVLNEYFFGRTGVKKSSASVAYSLMGSFWLDGGWATVVLGMWVTGVGLGVLRRYYERQAQNEWAMLFYAASLPFVVILLRGNLADTFSRTLFILVPLLVVPWLTSRIRRYS